MEESGVITTATSESDGRLMVDAGRCGHGKKKCLKCAIKSSKKDGAGGPGIDPAGYGKRPSFKMPKFKSPALKKKSIKLKSVKSLSSKKSTFKKTAGMKKASTLKKFLKGVL